MDDVLIIGGGIGGLAAALSLHEAGCGVRIYESVDEIRALGVGINLLPHAVRELDELGLAGELAAHGLEPQTLAYYTKRGELIWSEPRGLGAGYRWPQISIHRGVLQQILLDAVRQRIGSDRLHTGHHLGDVCDHGDHVEAVFVDRDGRPTATTTGALLIGADGIHSNVRRYFYPDEGAPKWNGALLWRGMTRGPRVLDGRTMFWAGHAHQKFVLYPIADYDDGTQDLNFIAELRFDGTELAEREDWNRAGRPEDFLPQFESWRFAWLDVSELIRSAPDGTLVYPMVDRDPIDTWTFGRITLLGDAAHPMYPIGSNGASQAILDARALAGCLTSFPDDPRRALQRYDDVRRPPTAAIVMSNRRMGPELPMQLVEDRAPDGFERLHDVITPDEIAEVTEGYRRTAGFAMAELNERPSLAAANYR